MVIEKKEEELVRTAMFQRFKFEVPSNSSLSTFISSDLAYARNPTINWHGMLLGPTATNQKNSAGKP